MSNKELSVGGFIAFSIANIVKHWLTFIGLSVIVVVVSIVCSAITSYLGASRGFFMKFLGFLAAIGSMAVMATVSFAFLKNILNVCRGQAVDFGAFIRVKPLVILYFFIAMLIVGATVFFGMVMFVVPGIILAYLLLLTPYLIIDRGLGPIRAIDESYRLTKDRLPDIFIVTFIGSVVAGLLSVFIITLLITIPMMCLMCVYLYLQLTDQPDAVPERPEAAAQSAAEPAREEPAAPVETAREEGGPF